MTESINSSTINSGNNPLNSAANKKRPLDGVRIIEVGQLIAGPFAGCMLGYFGAEVIKIEPPEGDAIRNWRVLDNGTSFWWRSIGRNKKSITLDLKYVEGQKIARQLMDSADVVIENFRPGVMESWGLGPEVLKRSNPRLIYARISGYGQTGPYSTKPGFASVCEGMSGFRYVNGFPDQAPVRPNLSIGDTISGIHAALGIALALLERNNSGEGQVVDVALYESMFNLMEAVVPEFSGAGVIREPSGTTVTGIVPTNTYRCKNGKYVVIGGNGDSIFQRLMQVAGHPEMASDPRMANNAGRVQHELEIDNALAAWCMSKDADEILQLLEQARVPAGPIYNVKDMFADPHFVARGMFEQVEINGKPLQLPAIAPRLAQTPGATDWPGGEIGSHTQDILQTLLGFSPERIAQLKSTGVI
jgi:crotonobetainyl-CoA:carnitine CoA-transferase CaiB-like acyl-CoA transferase